MEAINDTIQQETNSTQPNASPLQSFDEDFRLLRNVKENIPGVLRIGFTWSPFDDYLLSLWKWLKAAIGNEMSAYEDAHRRVNLLTFYDAILPLLEALYAINETNKIVEQTGDQQQKSMAETNLSIPPKVVIQEFCRSYTWEYCRLELWDWLNGVISNDEFYKTGMERSFFLIEYQCVHSLIESAYILCTQYKGQVLQNDADKNIDVGKKADSLVIIKHFFLNTPLEKAKTIMQEFYSAWVHHTAEIAARNEHSEKLLFCEYLVKFFEELHALANTPIEIENA